MFELMTSIDFFKISAYVELYIICGTLYMVVFLSIGVINDIVRCLTPS